MVAGPCKKARPARDCQEKKNSRCQTDSTKRVKEKSERIYFHLLSIHPIKRENCQNIEVGTWSYDIHNARSVYRRHRQYSKIIHVTIIGSSAETRDQNGGVTYYY